MLKGDMVILSTMSRSDINIVPDIIHFQPWEAMI